MHGAFSVASPSMEQPSHSPSNIPEYQHFYASRCSLIYFNCSLIWSFSFLVDQNPVQLPVPMEESSLQDPTIASDAPGPTNAPVTYQNVEDGTKRRRVKLIEHNHQPETGALVAAQIATSVKKKAKGDLFKPAPRRYRRRGNYVFPYH